MGALSPRSPLVATATPAMMAADLAAYRREAALAIGMRVGALLIGGVGGILLLAMAVFE